MQALPGALAPLALREQFVTWYAQPRSGHPGKFDKIPCSWATGVPCDAQDPANWTSAACALAMAPTYDRGCGSGAGFVFTAADPFFFLDIDGALQADGTWSPVAQELAARFAGAAVEVSHSGTGLHIFGTYAALPGHGTRHKPHHLELYTSGRFVALTGYHAAGDAGLDCTAALAATIAQYFPPPVHVAGAPQEWTTGPVPEWSGPTDDDELVRRALAAASRSVAGAFGGKGTFADLWAGNVPDDGRSEADQSLANHLAFWTGKDCERIERLMRRSALAREKWDSPSHAAYLSTTILKACAFVSKVASEPVRSTPEPSAALQAVMAAQPVVGSVPGQRDGGGEYKGAYEQLEHFAGCSFISDHLRIYSAPRNKLMVREAFDVEYGGHLFVLDPTGAKTTDSAYLALTRSRVNIPPVVDDLCFRPELSAGEIVTEGLRKYVNTYLPYEPVTAPGDASRFVELVRKQYPHANDADLLLDYLAAITQRPGVKVMWWPVLQGVQGNGKTLITLVMDYINGEGYSHRPNAAALAKDGMKFNAWLMRKTWIAIEEVSLSHKRDFLEEFKPVVTNLRMPFEKKGVDQITGDNRANGIICTNHRDGVPIDDNERRYGIFFAAQQCKADLILSGMDGDYFPDLYDWLHGRNAYAGQTPGFAVVAHYLKTRAVGEMPARAPETSSTREAIRFSLGRAEQEILEAIEEGRPGFAGGWVSSLYLARLLDGMRAGIPHTKRRGMMQALGYDWHPALKDGRVDNVVTPDNGKPKLFIKAGHIALNADTPGRVAELYTKAQTAPASTAAAAAFGAK